MVSLSDCNCPTAKTFPYLLFLGQQVQQQVKKAEIVRSMLVAKALIKNIKCHLSCRWMDGWMAQIFPSDAESCGESD